MPLPPTPRRDAAPAVDLSKMLQPRVLAKKQILQSITGSSKLCIGLLGQCANAYCKLVLCLHAAVHMCLANGCFLRTNEPPAQCNAALGVLVTFTLQPQLNDTGHTHPSSPNMHLSLYTSTRKERGTCLR
eukprot:363624-Chlamydomonas_euryale.AAC.8